MKEILDFVLVEERLDLFFVYLSFLGPIIGVCLGTLAGIVKHRIASHAVTGLLYGLVGTLLAVMWLVYKSIINHFGIDSVKGFLLNIAIFVVVGIGIGMISRWWHRADPARTNPGNPPTQETESQNQTFSS